MTSWWPQFGCFWVFWKVYIMFDVHIGFRPKTIIFVDSKRGGGIMHVWYYKKSPRLVGLNTGGGLFSGGFSAQGLLFLFAGRGRVITKGVSTRGVGCGGGGVGGYHLHSTKCSSDTRHPLIYLDGHVHLSCAVLDLFWTFRHHISFTNYFQNFHFLVMYRWLSQ